MYIINRDEIIKVNGSVDFDLPYIKDDVKEIFEKKKEVYERQRMVYLKRMYRVLFI